MNFWARPISTASRSPSGLGSGFAVESAGKEVAPSSAKAFRPAREIMWTPDILEKAWPTSLNRRLTGRMEMGRGVRRRDTSCPVKTQAWVTLHTKRPEGLVVVFTGPAR